MKSQQQQLILHEQLGQEVTQHLAANEQPETNELLVPEIGQDPAPNELCPDKKSMNC